MSTTTERSLRASFFRFVFGERQGYLCIATESAVKGDFQQRFFQWPIEEGKALAHIETAIKQHKNIWYCVNLLKRKERVKAACKPGNILWADLDECKPDQIEPPPQVAIESSPGRYQALWRLDEDIPPEIAEDYSRRIAYQYSENGADTGCWNLGRVLRVPWTTNYKYEGKPRVKLLHSLNDLLPAKLFDVLSKQSYASAEDAAEDATVPEPQPAEQIIVSNFTKLQKVGFAKIWDYKPEEKDDWSKLLWRLILTCIEAGLSKEEVFSVAYASSVNKYKRDSRPDRYLWRDVLKAYDQSSRLEIIAASKAFDMPELIPGDKYAFKKDTFVEQYTKWGSEATDACPVYHELTAFVVLSTLLGSTVRLQTSWGTVKPNIWALILGDSTLTRKSTAMRMGVDIIDFIDRDIILGTDGSSEGILAGIAGRPGKATLFWRDEIVGLVKEMAGKSYLAGIQQLFTQLYDGNMIARRLRKELITVTDPVFIFFGGGIQDQFYVEANDDFVYSGFLPRFLVVNGQTDIGKLRRLGPPTELVIDKRQRVYEKAHEIYKNYAVVGDVEIVGQVATMPQIIEAIPTQDAWDLNGEISERMTVAAYESSNKGMALPTFERMNASLLKMALLIAASRQVPDDYKIEVTADDIRRAAKYVQNWGPYSIDMILNLGKNASMRTIDKARKYVQAHPGVARSRVAEAMGVTKKQMDEIEATLVDREEITVYNVSGGKSYQPVNQ